MIIRTLVLTVCAAGFGLWMMGPAKESVTDPIVSASVKTGEQDYTVSNMENGSACLVTRGSRLSPHSRAIKPGKDCEAVWPGLAEARNWTQNDDGTVALTDGSGPRPPICLVHGDADPVVPVGNSIAAAEALRARGFAIELHISPGIGHGISDDGLAFAAAFIAGLRR